MLDSLHFSIPFWSERVQRNKLTTELSLDTFLFTYIRRPLYLWTPLSRSLRYANTQKAPPQQRKAAELKFKGEQETSRVSVWTQANISLIASSYSTDKVPIWIVLSFQWILNRSQGLFCFLPTNLGIICEHYYQWSLSICSCCGRAPTFCWLHSFRFKPYNTSPSYIENIV